MSKILTNNEPLKYSITPVLGLLIATLLFLQQTAIAGLGMPVLVLMYFAAFFLVVLSLRLKAISYPKPLLWTVIFFTLYHIALTISFLKTNSTTNKDISFLVSSFANVYWFLFVYIVISYKTDFSINLVRYIALCFGGLIVILWCYFILIKGDFFFMRNEFASLGVVGEKTVFYNPNALARTIGVIMILLTATQYSVKKQKIYWCSVSLNFLLSMIIMSTLSRANMASLIVFWIGKIYFDLYYIRGKKIPKTLFLVVMILVVTLLFVLIPTLRERAISLYNMLSLLFDNLPQQSLPPRLRTWAATLKIISAHMFYGVGFSTINKFLLMYGSVHLEANHTAVIAVHGGFFKIAAYGGLLALSAFFILLCQISRTAYRKLVTRTSTAGKVFAYYFLLMMMMLLIMNIGADNFGLATTWFMISIMYSIALLDEPSSIELKKRNEHEKA